jgi:hypothetical protein
VLILASWILEATPVFDLEALRIAAAASTSAPASAWTKIRAASSHEFTRPS